MTLAEAGEHGLVELTMVTHAGMTTADFEKLVTGWLSSARDPRFKKLPHRTGLPADAELLAYLRANGFTTFVVSGGGVEFMRPWTQRVYGIPHNR